VPTTLTGQGRCAGTCGELIQGFLSDGTPLHVTCPIDRFATVDVQLTPAPVTRLTGFDEASEKMRLACARILSPVSPGAFELAFTHRSELEPGKGMASSTADIVAIARAIADARGIKARSADLARTAAAVERSDGVMYDGVNAVDHLTGRRLKRFGWSPRYRILMCIPPASFSTSSADLDLERRSKSPVDDLLASLEQSSRDRDSRLFSEACSQSALRNQNYRFNPLVERVHPHLQALGADGLCVAHTGTVVGILFAGKDAELRLRTAIPLVRQIMPEQIRLERARAQWS
jgi:L-threonine kinase